MIQPAASVRPQLGYHAGPLVWLAIIAVTCVSLAALQKLLWLTVPFLLALILYYLLEPPMRWLIFRGMRREVAAASVMGVTLVLVNGGLMLVLPSIGKRLLDWQNTLERYVAGGYHFVDVSLRSLESNWSLFAKARLADGLAAQLERFSSASLSIYLEPIFWGVMAWTPALLLTPFLAFFFLRDGRLFLHFVARAVPNAFFERTLNLLAQIDQTAKAYFQGLLQLRKH
jgi:predicted PurR-regulated permease PerM